ncbi:MAG TPA: TPM domain-containing protein [Hymenobacter sp.]|uniref:TPM domain-containing protein n=1 Tax=Hymenobacter sp. TaxID=1898978 RepID=UPI002D80B434|nr:TPM domain-containing protein [Hymenobacter sp.]HET9502608.1 TPM domain-containing protein [Hymenobacter sp.]
MNVAIIFRPIPHGLKPWRALWALLLLLALALVARAQDIPPRPDPPRLVNDFAHVMQPQEVDALERKLVAYDDSTSSQIAIVTVPSLGGSDIFDYAQKLYQAWGIGRKGKDNGLLILVAVQEHKVRTHTGYGLEGAIPDALTKRIGDNTFAPAFKKGQYYAGLDRGTDQLIALAKGEYKADPADARPRGRRHRDNSGSGPIFWIIIGVLVLVFLLRARGGGGRGGRGSLGGGFMPPIIFGDFSGGRGVFGGGGGGFGGGGGGGGFGGFGGGSSGGGGSSSSW